MARVKGAVLILIGLSALAVLGAACAGKATPTPTSAPQPTATSAPRPTPTAGPQPTATTAPQPTATRAPQATPTTAAPGGSATAGKAVFDAQGCIACHKVKAAGGVVGPDLSTIGTKDEAYLRRAVLDPNADVAAGFLKDIMPKTFGQLLKTQELEDLIAYLKSLK